MKEKLKSKMTQREEKTKIPKVIADKGKKKKKGKKRVSER